MNISWEIKDIAADVLYKLPNQGNKKTKHEPTYAKEAMLELYDIKQLPEVIFPLYLKTTN